MTDNLIIRTENGDFDLYGSEDIVQTFSIFNLEDIVSRSGEYTNVFNLPLTANNIRLIEYAHFIPSINTLPYKKVTCSLIVDGIPFKNGFIEIESVDNSIRARFYSGNSIFYNTIKQQSLTEYDWSAYDHNWTKANAVANASNTSGFIYPLINYGEQTTALYLNVAKVLPCTYVKTILEKIITSNEYTSSYDFDTTELDVAILPATIKNPVYPAEYLLLNSVDASNTATQQQPITIDTPYLRTDTTFHSKDLSTILFNGFKMSFDTFAAGSSTYWDLPNKRFTANINGVYNYSLFAGFTSYTSYTLAGVAGDFTYNVEPPPGLDGGLWMVDFVSVLEVYKYDGVSTVAISREVITADATLASSVYLNAGETIGVRYTQYGTIWWKVDFPTIGTGVGNIRCVITPEIKSTATFTVDVVPSLVFGGLINYSLMLPKLKASDFLRDICIRFGLIISINEDTKVVSFKRFNDVILNIPSAKDWTNKLDETDLPNIRFKYDSYAQLNNFKHKDDKSVVDSPDNSNYSFLIQNSNLVLEKDIYVSPFGVSEDDVLIASPDQSAYINMYDSVKAVFNKDVAPRILFVRPTSNLTYYTDVDGTGGTPVLIASPFTCYFIDNTQDFSMGFGTNLIQRNSQDLINILQNLKVVTVDVNLNITDINSLDYFIPVYIRQFQSYFFISTINQFNFTKPNLTTVELIKLNP